MSTREIHSLMESDSDRLFRLLDTYIRELRPGWTIVSVTPWLPPSVTWKSIFLGASVAMIAALRSFLRQSEHWPLRMGFKIGVFLT